MSGIEPSVFPAIARERLLIWIVAEMLEIVTQLHAAIIIGNVHHCQDQAKEYCKAKSKAKIMEDSNDGYDSDIDSAIVEHFARKQLIHSACTDINIRQQLWHVCVCILSVLWET